VILRISGPPIYRKSHRTVNKINYDPSKKDKEAFGWKVKAKLLPTFKIYTKPILVGFKFHIQVPKYLCKKKIYDTDDQYCSVPPDLSNLIKFVEDALNKIVWHDDKLIVGYLESFKRYSKFPRTRIEIEEVI
jgi:Holliday junction resolvase RusA-like endonuclease